jgi:hypothetical protein
VLRQPTATVAAGMPAATLLAAANDGKGQLSRAMLLVNEHMRNLPLTLTAQSHAFMLTEFLETKDPAIKAGPLIIVLAKTQRKSAVRKDQLPQEADARDARKHAKPAAADGGKAAKKRRAESDGNTAVAMADVFFWRWEDEMYFNHRDARVAVTAHKFAPMYDGQPDSDVPLAMAFGITIEGMKKAMKEISAFGAPEQ